MSFNIREYVNGSKIIKAKNHRKKLSLNGVKSVQSGYSGGNLINTNILNLFAPSITLASITSFGIFCKPAKNINIANPVFFHTSIIIIEGKTHSALFNHGIGSNPKFVM